MLDTRNNRWRVVMRHPWTSRTAASAHPKEAGGPESVVAGGNVWNLRPVDRNVTCVEEECSEPAVLGKSYRRAHCAQYYVIPRKRT